MAIDPNIALGVRPIEIANPLAQYGQIAQIQAAQNQNQLQQMQMREAEAMSQERNALRQLNPNAPDYEQQLFKVNPQLGIAFRKETNTAAAQEATRQKALIDAAAAKQKLLSQAHRDISTRPSDANIMAHTEDIQASDLFSPVEKQKALATQQTLLSMPFGERATYLSSQGATAGEMKPQYVTQNLGATSRISAIPAFGGAPTTVNEAPIAMSAAQIEQNKIAQRNADIAAGQLGVSQGRLGLERQRVGLEGQRVELAKNAQSTEGLPPKEIQKREAALPQATSAIKGFETKSDSFIKDLEKLRDHPGLSQITGLVAGRVPAVTSEGRAAQALYDKVVAKGGFQALQDMRDASKTGGALGNVSNQEGKQLTASFAAIQRTQDAKDVRAAIDDAVANIQGAKTRMREAYDSTYSYKTGNAPASGGVVEFGSLK
jgi:hypothetical protein